MPQPRLPAPLAPRPEPGVQLLEAVWQRNSQRSRRLAQQWVHRRGVRDLQRFCSRELHIALGSEAVSWLEEQLLIAIQSPDGDNRPASRPHPRGKLPTAPAEPTTPGQPGLTTVLSHALVDSGESEVTAAGTEDADPVSLEAASSNAAIPPPSPPSSDGVSSALSISSCVTPLLEGPKAGESALLQARAVAAVDEAFVALAQSFQEDSQIDGDSTPASTPPVPASQTASQPTVAYPETVAARSAQPEPLPVRVGLWPSLRASAAGVSAALLPVGFGGTPPAAGPRDHQGTPISVGKADASDDSTRPLEASLRTDEYTDASGRLPLAIATALEPRQGPSDNVLDPHEKETALAAARALPVRTAAATTPDAHAPAGALDGLLKRLRGRLQVTLSPQLSRLKAVMQDCLEESLALLRAPEPALQDDEGDDSAEPVAPPVKEPPNPAWSMERFSAATPVPSTGNLEQQNPASRRPLIKTSFAAAPSPAKLPGPSAVPDAPAATPLAPLLPQAAISDSAQAGEGPPAPTPVGLSDLQAWLPSRRDLPRAS